ncbi:MAG: class III extradiol ring-cleavage dioxygenase [bacterium]
MAKEIESDNIGIQIDNNRGIDHAAWAVLAHIYKDEDIQVIEMSLDVDKSFEQHFELGKKLAKWRSEDILFIGSGNIIHNLGDISFDENSKPFAWAVQLDNWFKEQIHEYNIENLLNYSEYLPNYQQGIPTTEHYIPLLYILGMKSAEEKVTTIHESIQNGSISMRSIEIG